MPEFHKFMSNMPSCNYIFTNGKVAPFVAGRYITKIQSEIDQLNTEIENGHPNFFVDPNEVTVSSENVDPLEGIKRRAIEEYLAQQAAANKPDNDRGNTSVADQLAALTTMGAIGVGTQTAGGLPIAEVSSSK